MRRPSIAKVMGIDHKCLGLSDIIADNLPVENAIVSGESTMDVLTAGVLPLDPLKILGSNQFRQLLEQLSQRYDRIIIDTAPIGVVSDPLLLSRYLDSLIYVIKADATPAKVVVGSIKKMQNHNAPLMGVVLNQVDYSHYKFHGDSYDNYYYTPERDHS